MAKNTIELIERMQSSYHEYFAEIPDDRLMALSINPVLVTMGAIEIKSFMDIDGQAKGSELVAKAKALLLKRVMELMRAKIAESDVTSSGDSNDEEVRERGTICYILNALCSLLRISHYLSLFLFQMAPQPDPLVDKTS